MLSEKRTSLNVISENSAIELISRFIRKGYNVKNVFVDTVGTAATYQKLLENHFKGKNITFRVEQKADSLFKVVSAASIVAKVNRDRILTNWKFKENIKFDTNYGSGYPGDALTVEWLKRNCHGVMGFPNLVRYSWSTVTKLMDENMVKIDAYNNEFTINHDYLGGLGLIINKNFKPLISRQDLYCNIDEVLSMSGRFEL